MVLSEVKVVIGVIIAVGRRIFNIEGGLGF